MKIESITVFENIVGLILAVFIIFQITPSTHVCKEFNKPVYILLALVFIVVLFLTLHPIIGILFLIYFYQLLIHGKQDSVYKKNQTMKSLNPEKEIELEEVVIHNSNFARIKNKDEDQDTKVVPVLEKLMV